MSCSSYDTSNETSRPREAPIDVGPERFKSSFSALSASKPFWSIRSPLPALDFISGVAANER